MRKAMKNVLLTLLVLTLGIAAAFLVYCQFFAAGGRDLSGEWAAGLDLTDEAAVTALGWLQEIEAVSVSLEDMESCMEGLTVQVNLTMEQTSRFQGTFRCRVQPESYAACEQEAYEAFAGVFRELLAERLHMAGYTGATDQETIETLVSGTFGMSTVSYLRTYGPALLPTLEELQSRYDGSGVYQAEEGVLVRQFEEGGSAAERTENYIRKGSCLVLSEQTVPDGSTFSGRPVVYTLIPAAP